MKRIFALSALMLGALTLCAQNVTLTGTLQSSNGLPAKNYTIQFTPTQFGFIAGTGVLVNTTTTCATSTDGTVVGIGNPLVAASVTAAFTGTLPANNYYVKYGWQNGVTVTLASPESVVNLAGTGSIVIAVPPGGAPSGATFMDVFIGTAPGTETYQGNVAAGSPYTQSAPLANTGIPSLPYTLGQVPSNANTTICTQVANDVIWPIGTGYKVSLTTSDGSSVPGYPMQWQLLGAGSTINLSNGLPYYHGIVTFPTPILASPFNHGLQSIAGDLNMMGYTLRNVGVFGIGTANPAWPIDNESGPTNSLNGYLVNGSGGTVGQCLGSDGNFWDVPVNCLTSTAGINYQTVRFGITNMTQRGTLGIGTGLQAVDVLSAPSRTVISIDNTVPVAGTGAVNHGVCQFSAGPPVVLGHCTSALDGSGVCTCVN